MLKKLQIYTPVLNIIILYAVITLVDILARALLTHHAYFSNEHLAEIKSLFTPHGTVLWRLCLVWFSLYVAHRRSLKKNPPPPEDKRKLYTTDIRDLRIDFASLGVILPDGPKKKKRWFQSDNKFPAR